jgi:hypothetical protein
MIGGIRGAGGIGSDQIKQATKKPLHEWIEILDTWGYNNKRFTPICNYLMRHYKLHRYWAQGIAVEYIMRRSYTSEIS